ncbi:hypothetical protein ACI8AA_01355 [Geodermatophilus sp. SYSU D01180]
MSSRALLLDPVLLLPTAGADEASMAAFWLRLAEWSGDGRARVGESTRRLAYEHFAQFGWPERPPALAPEALRRDFHRLLGQVLSRVVQHAVTGGGCSVVGYRGSSAASSALAEDLSRCGADVVLGVASVGDVWETPGAHASVSPPPPDNVPICLEPNAVLAAEQTSRVRQHYADVRVNIVGGQVNERVVADLEAAIGPREVSWLPCERHKKPNLSAWKGLAADKDVAVCITGQISHAASIKARDLARQRAVEFLPVETARDIVSALIDRVT